MHSIKPGREPSFMGGVAGLVAAGFGIIWTIMAFAITRDSPFPVVGWVFPLFGIVFVMMGLAMAAYNFFNATTKKRMSIIDITAPGEEPDPLNQHFGESFSGGDSIETRLGELQGLKESGAVSEAEFAELRRRILQEI